MFLARATGWPIQDVLWLEWGSSGGRGDEVSLLPGHMKSFQFPRAQGQALRMKTFHSSQKTA